jgi:polysaccharide export outer membrane protein
MRISRWQFACVVVLSLVVAVSAQAPDAQGNNSAPPLSGAAGAMPSTFALAEYRIGPEDVLDISVWKNADLTRTVTVRPDGRISMPLLNDIQAANLTPLELRGVLEQGYSRFVNEAEVSVIVREIHSVKVSVLGMVKLPGRYELRTQTTVLEALALAGGLSEFAKRDQITIFRRDGQRWQRLGFDYSNVLSRGVEENVVLRPGDIIVVP